MSHMHQRFSQPFVVTMLIAMPWNCAISTSRIISFFSRTTKTCRKCTPNRTPIRRNDGTLWSDDLGGLIVGSTN